MIRVVFLMAMPFLVFDLHESMQSLKGRIEALSRFRAFVYIKEAQTQQRSFILKAIVLLSSFLFFSLAHASPAFTDRYDEYEEPVQEEYDPYLECKHNTESYFPTCWAMSRASRSPADDSKAVSCFLERLEGLRQKDPLKYLPLKSDPKDPESISEYKKTKEYAQRLRAIEEHLEYLPNAPFCLYSNAPTSYSEGKIKFTLRGLRFSNSPKGEIKANRVQGETYRQVSKGRVPLAYFFVRGASFLLEFISVCGGTTCPYFFSITQEGSVF